MKDGIITLKADKLVGPLMLRARVHNGRLVDTELTRVGRQCTPEQLLNHERAWYDAALAAVKEEVAS